MSGTDAQKLLESSREAAVNAKLENKVGSRLRHAAQPL